MRLKAVPDNGNVAALEPREVPSFNNYDNKTWLSENFDPSSIYHDKVSTNNSQYITNYHIYDEIGTNLTDNASITVDNFKNITDEVCNKEYRINTENNINFLKSLNDTLTANLEGVTETVFAQRETFPENTNVSANTTPCEDEERAFDNSDTDEMSEQGLHLVPRGIVNPNYPGFQHLAHTLQDYSSNIENFYHSENDMTDDDIDLEIVESTYESEFNKNVVEDKNLDNNNNNNNYGHDGSELPEQTMFPPQTDIIMDSEIIVNKQNDIPDLLKTLSVNNNSIESFEIELNCNEADIDNNFETKDIIGDFNKEIEYEIKQLLNYNINIQDDLQELRKDIQDTFAKPIEDTINNISEVVNHVIKKLVETHGDVEDEDNIKLTNEQETIPSPTSDLNDVNKQNDANTRTEMHLSRPTFLLIEHQTTGNIKDAFLSDAKDEIKIDYEKEYDTETLSNNVERTIQQLSTELRKIIPKLDEMRESDRLWNESKQNTSVVIDGNSNEIASSSQQFISTVNAEYKGDISRKPVNQTADAVLKKPPVARIEPQASRERLKETSSTKSFRSAHTNTSVRKSASAIIDSDLGSFDVYNIETALPKIDLDAIESHLKAAKEAERRKRNDREEIRKRLAMGAEAEEYYSMGHIDRPGRKPSLHSRLQSGKNLQICFMNEAASDNESQASDIEKNFNSTKSLSRTSIFQKSNFNHPYQTRPLSVNITKHDKISAVPSVAKLRPTSFISKPPKSRSAHSLGQIELRESDFYLLQATLQTEARIALAQAKEMARIQMERERRSRPVSPVTEMLRRSMEKANVPLAADRRRVSRQLLTDMNIAQLQVIVNELHGQIEGLNEQLVQLLMARDDLHMGQDSMLVDIEDLTRYLGVKEQTKKTKGSAKSGVRRLASLVHK